MPYADNDGVAIHYDRVGPSAASTVVFVEGLGYGKWMWDWQRDPLSDAYDTIVLDNRGTGDSDVPDPPYSIPEMATDLHAVLDDAGVDAAHVVGASMGGMVAQRFAIDFDRTASLSLLCTSPGGDDAEPTPPATMDRIMTVPDDLGPREALRYKMEPATSPGFLDANPELTESIIDNRLESDAPDRARTAQAEAVQAFDASDTLSTLTMPTLIIHGTADRVVPVANAELLADHLPHATVERIEDAPHWVFIEAADAVTNHLREFLDAHS